MAKLGTTTVKSNGGAVGKVIGFVVVAIIVIIALFNIFNFADTDANKIGLHYGGGVVEDKKFKSVIPPGSTNSLIGPGDTVYAYPIDQRSYIIGGAGADTDAGDEVTVVSKDNVRLGVRVQVYFTLNRTEETLKSFHERIGLKTDAFTERGWNSMLQSYFRPQIDRALSAVATNYAWAELYNNEAKKSEFQTAAAKEFTRLLPAAVGGDYFCGPSYNGGNACGELSFTVQKPTPLDKGIIDGLEAKQRAELAKATQEQTNQRVNVELESVKKQVQMLGAQGYLLKTAIESGKIQFMVIPQGTNVSVPTGTATLPAER
ncbi:SPFH domain-containing protein [Kribbella sandramycini]|uniref:Putative membrane protein YqiK n=1 Tax=Kribbella sandramycini TaxID=60450 RepID=A0A7Y4P3S7_9ACTN|nr:SPFH domain-containing protein [Kribbella sandramycini]MBB6571822.1 putative membrane protein YqiK [Kribbella sandramycini]NOL44464.1 SPFH domain-containing protein [Kribbella sandramycini]